LVRYFFTQVLRFPAENRGLRCQLRNVGLLTSAAARALEPARKRTKGSRQALR
jgi:hypothetical protein